MVERCKPKTRNNAETAAPNSAAVPAPIALSAESAACADAAISAVKLSVSDEVSKSSSMPAGRDHAAAFISTAVSEKAGDNAVLKADAGAGVGTENEDEAGFEASSFLKTVPRRPGCYRMYDHSGTVIYVGKAKNLKNRLSSYFLQKDHDIKTRTLVSHIAHIEYTVTFSESEALLLENELIKKYQPHYNILLRDDKSYPYLLLTSQHEYPGIYYHRGAKRIKGEYFGPFPDSTAVKDSLRLLQQLFPIRQCEDSFFAHRSRPCLMGQMGRCLAPCVFKTEQEKAAYQSQTAMLVMFLQGRKQELLNALAQKMEHYAEQLEFEEAARLRDQMIKLRRIQESNAIIASISSPVDVIGLAQSEGVSCIHVLFIRDGRIFGTRSYFPANSGGDTPQEVLLSFLTQFYLNDSHAGLLPDEVVLSRAALTPQAQAVPDSASVLGAAAPEDETSVQDTGDVVAAEEPPAAAREVADGESASVADRGAWDEVVVDTVEAADTADTEEEAGAGSESGFEDTLVVLQQTIREQFGRKVRFIRNVRGAKRKFLQLAQTNAEVALQSKLASSSTARQRICDLEQLLKVKEVKRMECYDISHTMGEQTVASCVVFNREGPDSSRYRRFNISGITPGDDFAAMHQVLTRRFKDVRAVYESDELPDIIFIDGGRGQLKQAEEVLTRAFAAAHVTVAAPADTQSGTTSDDTDLAGSAAAPVRSGAEAKYFTGSLFDFDHEDDESEADDAAAVAGGGAAADTLEAAVADQGAAGDKAPEFIRKTSKKAGEELVLPLPLIVGVAKGEGRKEGLETLILGFTHERINLNLGSPALQLVLHIRDEAHRFAITGHRQRREKARRTSRLESIPGIGAKRRQALLSHLGGMQEVMRAGMDELQKVPGISPELAERIYTSLHS